MKIAVNCRLLQKDRSDGISIFSREVLNRLVHLRPDDEFVFIFDRPFAPEMLFSGNVKSVVATPKARHPLAFWFWFEFSVKRILKQEQADLFFTPDGFLSLSSDVPVLSVVHDLNFEHYPQYLPWYITLYYRYFFPRFCKKASKIITVSEFSRKDLIKRYGISQEKISVIYNGVNEAYKGNVDVDKCAEVRKRWAGGESFFLYVGGLHPRKNIKNLIKAFDLYKEGGNPKKLVLVGDFMWGDTEVKRELNQMKYRKDVVFTGPLNEDELVLLFQSAHALLYPSLFEGFGIPIVEAFYTDLAVLTSNVSAMPEIGGDAVCLVNPQEVNSIRKGMEALDNEMYRKDLIVKGQKRKELFSWDKTTLQISKELDKLMKQ